MIEPSNCVALAFIDVIEPITFILLLCVSILPVIFIPIPLIAFIPPLPTYIPVPLFAVIELTFIAG